MEVKAEALWEAGPGKLKLNQYDEPPSGGFFVGNLGPSYRYRSFRAFPKRSFKGIGNWDNPLLEEKPSIRI